MPIYRLTKEIIFPPPDHAEPDGLLAVGGDLSTKRLLLAYHLGIFPWYAKGQPILWWSPDPRLVLDLGEFHLSRRLRQTLRTGAFAVTLDQAFTQVIHSCAIVPRKGQRGTWITAEMEKVRQTYDRELDAKHAAARGLVDAIVTPENIRASLMLALQTCLTRLGATAIMAACTVRSLVWRRGSSSRRFFFTVRCSHPSMYTSRAPTTPETAAAERRRAAPA